MVSQCMSVQMFSWLADASVNVAFILLTFLGQVLVIHRRKLAGHTNAKCSLMVVFLFFYCGKLDWLWYNEKATFALLHSAVCASEAVMCIVNAYLLKGCVCVAKARATK